MQKFSEMCITTYRDLTHQATLANCGTMDIWVGYSDDSHQYMLGFQPQDKKDYFNLRCDFSTGAIQ